MLLTGRALAAFGGALMFVAAALLAYPGPPHVPAAAFGLMLVFASVVRRPLIILALLPAAAFFTLPGLVGEGPVKWAGYAMLVALLGGYLIYEGDKLH